MIPISGISTSIPIFLLTGIGAWLYGVTRGLSIIALIYLYHLLLYIFIYPQYFEPYQAKISSLLVLIGIVYLFAHLRRARYNILLTNQQLDHLVTERSLELSRLTEKLLENYEATKIKQAQLLHDGIGQQLTGIQLISASLSEQLLLEKNPTVSITHHLRTKTNKLHNRIRKTSRLLFPVLIEQVGLTSALDELSSCLQDIKPVKSVTAKMSILPQLPSWLMLQIYRICQESILFTIDHLNADQISLELSPDSSGIQITIIHNGRKPDASARGNSFNLIQHRLRMLRGQMSIISQTANSRTAQFFIPYPPTEHLVKK
jgi:signal transduction histidine kinase